MGASQLHVYGWSGAGPIQGLNHGGRLTPREIKMSGLLIGLTRDVWARSLVGNRLHETAIYRRSVGDVGMGQLRGPGRRR